jgi:D-alanyl-D-alanine endopeptidase (penicillin-binding protein 7)
MSKTTFILVFIFLLLTAACGVVAWQLLNFDDNPLPVPELSSVELGLPRVRAARDEVATASASALLWDTSTQVMLFEKNGFERRPIASITKLMTAMVALDVGIDWNKQATIQPNEYVAGGRLLLHPGETVTVQDLFNASLLGSANNATLAYVRELGVPEEEFIRAMNRKAIELGLEQTEFVDVTGLSERNVSTAYEVARMAEHAFLHYPDIARASSQSAYAFILGGSGREHTIPNTNKLISEGGMKFIGSKTGYLYEAGWCLVVQGSDTLASRMAVVLGSDSEATNSAEVQQLLQLFPP